MLRKKYEVEWEEISNTNYVGERISALLDDIEGLEVYHSGEDNRYSDIEINADEENLKRPKDYCDNLMRNPKDIHKAFESGIGDHLTNEEVKDLLSEIVDNRAQG